MMRLRTAPRSPNLSAHPPARVRRQRGFLVGAAMTLAAGSAALIACATSENESGSAERPGAVQVPPANEDSGVLPEAEAPCTVDCEYFPPSCAADLLCPNALFDSTKPSGGPNEFDGRTLIHLVRGRSATDVWAIGSGGAIAHFDGTSWVRSELPVRSLSPMGRLPMLKTLWLQSGSEVGINGLGAFDVVYSHGLVATADAGADAGAWVERFPPMILPVGEEIPTGQLQYFQTSQVVTYGWAAPGSEWFWVSTQSPYIPAPYNPAGLVRLRQVDATSFEGEVTGIGAGPFAALHGSSADDFWAVGMNGASAHVTGASGDSPTVTAYNTQTRNALFGVWAVSATDAWAVGFNGTIRHYTGDPLLWEKVSGISEGVQLNAVFGTSSSDIWAVGNEAVVLRYDGTRWSRMKVAGLGGRRPNLVSVWTPDPQHVWIGGDGVVLSFGGTP
ncbi:MAG: hypothetical protein K0S65_5750 [Labilithrix sp.]|nr:hypothetical protein [Labilithrix sp.]